VQQYNLPIPQVRGGRGGDVTVAGRGYDHHNYMRALQGFPNVVGHFDKLPKAADAARVVQVYPAALGDNFNIGKGAVIQRDFVAHQRHMGCHGFAAVARPYDCVSQVVVHCLLLFKGRWKGVPPRGGGCRQVGRLRSRPGLCVF